MKMNIPNKLTIARIILAPFSMIFILYAFPNETWARIFAASLFLLTAVTDLVDGKLARRFGWITNFGKFMDPLADKFMVFGVLIAMCTSPMYEKFHAVLIWVTVIVIFRELAVTSMRLLVVSSDGTVVARKLARQGEDGQPGRLHRDADAGAACRSSVLCALRRLSAELDHAWLYDTDDCLVRPQLYESLRLLHRYDAITRGAAFDPLNFHGISLRCSGILCRRRSGLLDIIVKKVFVCGICDGFSRGADNLRSLQKNCLPRAYEERQSRFRRYPR